ncbi:MAG TPA: CHASE sensor domain-containing protein [Rhizomicrobium sp.]|nr:CHASE sensor domain-containing protein [Rhizomicrobium sp.]
MASILRLHRTAIPAIALAAAALIGLFGILGSVYEDQLYRAQKLDELSIQAEILASSVSAALAFNDNATAQQYANALAANPQLDMALIYDNQGRVVARFVRAGIDPRPPAHRATGISGNHVSVVLPVAERGERLGSVYLDGEMDSLQRRLLKYGIVVIIAAMAALLLMVLAVSQHAMSTANRQLEAQARDLVEANRTLQNEMRERAKAEEALRQSQKMEAVGQLSGGIAHDFNNFLTIIKGNLHLLKRRLAQGQTDVQKYVDSAIEGVDRAVSVTQRVLAFSRRQPLTPEPNNLSTLVADALPLIRQSVGAQIEVETHLDADWWVYCDTNQMENVLLNLAINARDAMPEGGKLTFATRNLSIDEAAAALDIRPGEYVELVVKDTGFGMSDEVKAKALDPFFTTKPHGKGTGLGLSTTFGYIRQTGGALEIDTALGEGTAIRIRLPRRYVDSLTRSA